MYIMLAKYKLDRSELSWTFTSHHIITNEK